MMEGFPEGWEEVKLSEILESLENGNRPKGGIAGLTEGIPSIGGEHLNSNGGFNYDKIRYIPIEFYNSLKRGKIKKGDVLVVKDGATTGKTSFINNVFPFDEAAVNEHIFILRGKKENVNQKFLFYHLRSPIGKRQIDANFHGAAIGGINTQFVKNYKLLLPPLPVQKKIADILEKAEKLKMCRAEADKLTDEFLKSTFMEMFDDPVKNPKGWEMKKIANVISSIEAGWSVNGERRLCKENEHGVLKVSAVTTGVFLPNEHKVISSNQILRKVVTPEKGDLLFSRANTRELVGATCLINKNYQNLLLPDKLWKIKPDKKQLIPEYIKFILSHPAIRKEISNNSTGTSGSMYNISMSKLKLIVIPIPPLPLQQKFASIVQQVEQMRRYQQESKAHIDDLFNALMQKAFRGELVA